MLREKKTQQHHSSITKTRDIKVARYLLHRQFPVQQVLEATNLDPKELSLLIQKVRKENKKTD